MGKTNVDKFTKEQIIQALENSAGIYLGAAQVLGCSSSTIANYVNRYPDLAAAKDKIKHDFVDLAESKLVESVQDGHLTAVIFTLKTLGKDRGYSERHELTGAGGGPVAIAPDLRLAQVTSFG